MEQNMKSIKDKIIQKSTKDREWGARVKRRQENEEWTSLSFKIAVQILKHLRLNQISQKSIAEKLDCSPQYLSKLLKGKENLTLETIWKLQNVLDITLIEISEAQSENKNTLNVNDERKEDGIELVKEVIYTQTREPISIDANFNYYVAV